MAKIASKSPATGKIRGKSGPVLLTLTTGDGATVHPQPTGADLARLGERMTHLVSPALEFVKTTVAAIAEHARAACDCLVDRVRRDGDYACARLLELLPDDPTIRSAFADALATMRRDAATGRRVRQGSDEARRERSENARTHHYKILYLARKLRDKEPHISIRELARRLRARASSDLSLSRLRAILMSGL